MPSRQLSGRIMNQPIHTVALAAAAGGSLRPLIGQRFPLPEAAAAHAAIGARATVGKTLLDVGSR